MTYIVALTGGIGSGKSTVATAFAQLGVVVIDADIVARQVVEPGSIALDAIRQRYGAEILLADGSLDRAALRRCIFSDEQEKNWLSQLLHPLIQQETRRQIAQARSPYVLWVLPLLIENNLQDQANRILVVDVDSETQLARTLARDNISPQLANNIIATQVSREQRLTFADDVINNNGTQESVLPLVAALHQSYLALAASASQQDPV